MARGENALGLAVVDDVIALKNAVLIVEHDGAVGGDDVVVLVIDELVGVDVELGRVAPRLRRVGAFSAKRGAAKGERQRQRDRQRGAARRPETGYDGRWRGPSAVLLVKQHIHPEQTTPDRRRPRRDGR